MSRGLKANCRRENMKLKDRGKKTEIVCMHCITLCHSAIIILVMMCRNVISEQHAGFIGNM